MHDTLLATYKFKGVEHIVQSSLTLYIANRVSCMNETSTVYLVSHSETKLRYISFYNYMLFVSIIHMCNHPCRETL